MTVCASVDFLSPCGISCPEYGLSSWVDSPTFSLLNHLFSRSLEFLSPPKVPLSVLSALDLAGIPSWARKQMPGNNVQLFPLDLPGDFVWYGDLLHF